MERSELVKTCLRTALDAGARITPLALPAIDDRGAWERLDEALRGELVRAGEEAAGAEWPVLLVTDYMDFLRTGNRVRFEDKNFTRRRMLGTLILAECAENRGRFLDEILNGIYLILGETSWCLPAHNSHVRDGKQAPVPDAAHPVVDLFAAETGAFLGVAEAILRPALTGISPLITETVDLALAERIFLPYVREHFWWKGDGVHQMCNWTSWITQNVLLALFTRRRTEEGGTAAEETASGGTGRTEASATVTETLYRQFLEQAAASLDYFLDAYGEDGCCDEGAQYYRHAALTLFQSIDIMDRVLLLPGRRSAAGREETISAAPGRTVPSAPEEARGAGAPAHGPFLPLVYGRAMARVFADLRVRNLADYIRRVHVAGPYYLNFADCSPIAGRRGAREFLFGLSTENGALARFAAEDFTAVPLSERILPDEINLYDRLQQVFTSAAMLREEGEKSPAASPDRPVSLPSAADALETQDGDRAQEVTWFPSVGLFIARGDSFVLAAKAGDNGDSHNHNDVGSVILYRDGQPVLIDLGVGTYTRQTFSKDRYSLWFMQSQYHNLPSFRDGEILIQQKPGEEYGAASVLCGVTGEGFRFLEMDIAPAYGDPRVRSYVRRVSLCTGSRPTGDVAEDGAERCGERTGKPAVRTEPEERRADGAEAAVGSVEGCACVIIEDRWDADLPAVLSFMTYEEPAVGHHDGDLIRLSVGSCLMELSGIRELRLETRPIDDERLGIAWKHDCFRILAEPAGSSCRIQFDA